MEDIMALKKCTECNNEVSSKAKICPQCGAPVKQNISSGVGCLIIGFLVMLAMCATLIDSSDNASKTTSKPKTSWKQEDNSTMAYIMMEDFVKQKLKSPSTAKFPGVFDGKADHIKYLRNQEYRIVSWVDSQNAFGATIRTRFIGEIQQISKDEWQLNSLNFSQ
jgi:hypothetical protein